MKLLIPLMLIFLFCHVEVSSAQDLLKLNNVKFTQLESGPLPAELFVFTSDPTIEQMVQQILTQTGKTRNFQLVASNVESVTAVLSESGRYILYSKKHFTQNPNPTYQSALLAYAIGRQVYEHTFLPQARDAEDAEAKEYMGYSLCKNGESWQKIARVLNSTPFKKVNFSSLPKPKNADSIATSEIVKLGFDRAEASILISPGAGFIDEGKGIDIAGFRQFPLPPQKPSAQYELKAYFQRCSTLRNIYKSINASLGANGYNEKAYYYVKGGFAIVTRIEQFKKEGPSYLDSRRWSVGLNRKTIFNFSDYLSELLTAQPEYFRVFAFVIADEVFSPTRSQVVNTQDFEKWLGEGSDRVPEELLDTACNQNTSVTALVYVFNSPGNRQPAVFVKTSELDGKKHLEASKILFALKP